ncbi:hypothetical protein [Nostoc sp. 106C]|uniref:hypothetical protein n=1 Tax=Nostoc sp. 106C TaxID=1932667 RepID=UPI000A3AB232|nr:hypothetical protein [Nostoc sp. 106C]OUL28796.1 hypothetical protein BV375_16900 [Nostoc sp. 106C]
MQLKSISYKRVLNLGNYENKHLELFAEVALGEDENAAILELMELVERNIRSQIGKQFQKEILDLEAQRNKLSDEVYYLKQELIKLGKIKDEPAKEDNPDIPFETGGTASSDPGNF